MPDKNQSQCKPSLSSVGRGTTGNSERERIAALPSLAGRSHAIRGARDAASSSSYPVAHRSAQATNRVARPFHPAEQKLADTLATGQRVTGDTYRHGAYRRTQTSADDAPDGDQCRI